MASLFGANAFSTPVGQRIGIFKARICYFCALLKVPTLYVLVGEIFCLQTEYLLTLKLKRTLGSCLQSIQCVIDG